MKILTFLGIASAWQTVVLLLVILAGFHIIRLSDKTLILALTSTSVVWGAAVYRAWRSRPF